MVDIVGIDLLPFDTSKLQYFTFLTLEQPLFPSDQIHSGLFFCVFSQQNWVILYNHLLYYSYKTINGQVMNYTIVYYLQQVHMIVRADYKTEKQKSAFLVYILQLNTFNICQVAFSSMKVFNLMCAS